MFQKVMWLSLAGTCGTVSRFALCELAAKTKFSHLPIGTFAVNIIGSFIFGLLYALAQRRMLPHPELRVILLVGFMGAFTTFSTFDTAKLVRSSQWMLAFGNIFASVALGVAAVAAGVMLGKAA